MTQSSSVSGFSRTGASNFVPRKGLIMDSRNRKRLWTRNCILFILPWYSRCTDTPRRVWRYWLKIGPYIGNFYFKVGFSIFACYSTYKMKRKEMKLWMVLKGELLACCIPYTICERKCQIEKEKLQYTYKQRKNTNTKMTIELELFRFFSSFSFLFSTCQSCAHTISIWMRCQWTLDSTQ